MSWKCACGAEIPAAANETATCPRCGIVSDIAVTQESTGTTDPLRTFGYETYNELTKQGAVPSPFANVPGYEVLGALGQGGMGLVLRARDPQLQRLIAIKVLHEKHRNSAELAQRFLEEAQITGQLQHPGIPPVHEVGTLPDGRPFLAMKLIQGRTLQELLKERVSPQQDLPRFLGSFEQVCQTMAYAHARGVVHRDLKPGNIMVGAFGEVQVMDWGLAKLLQRGRKVQSQGEPAGASDPVATDGRIHTARADNSWAKSRPGAALGTPAFMPPEQANGELDKLDARCDVFGLGAILTVILTGQPPYIGQNMEEVFTAARAGDLAAVHDRLARCGADAELTELARRCLAAQPADRLPDGNAVAQGISAYLRSVQEKLQQAELNRAAADVRLAHERKRRRLTAGIAVLSVCLILLGVVGWVYVQRSQAAYIAQTTVKVNQELGRAQSLAEEARKIVMTDSASRAASLRLWTDSLAIADQAQAVLQTAQSDELTRQSVADTINALHREANQAAADRQMLARLDAARDQRLVITDEDTYRGSAKNLIVYGHAAGEAYAAAFREYGIDLVNLPAKDAAESIRGSRIPVQLAAALDDWLILTVGKPLADKLVEVANAGDADSFRSRLRAACAREDGPELAKLYAESPQQVMSVPVTLLLADGLQLTNQRAESIRVLERARQLHPDDFWINDVLGVHLMYTDPSRADEAGRCFAAATARRPDLFFIHSNLASALLWQGKYAEAKKEFTEALRINPEYVQAKVELAKLLLEEGDLAASAALCAEAVRLKPRDPAAVSLLAFQHARENRELEALELVREMVQANPQWGHAHLGLGDVLYFLGQNEPAAEAYREALAVQPELAGAQTGLANALVQLKQLDAAEKALAPALARHGEMPDVHFSHVNLLFAQNKPEAALQAMARVVALRPAYWHFSLLFGDYLLANGQHDKAILAYTRALELKPDSHEAQFGLGEAYRAKNEPLTAVLHYQQAIAIDPKQAKYHSGLGLALSKQDLLAQALPAFEQALILEPERPERMQAVGQTLQLMKNFQDAIPLLRRAAELMPKNAVVRNHLGEALHQSGDPEGAIAVFREATEVDSQVAAVWSNLGNAHLLRKELESAADAHRRAREIEPTNALHFAALGGVLRRQGRTEAALTEFRRAIQIQPGDARIYLELGLTFQEAGRAEEAQGAFRQAVWLDPENPTAHVHYGLTYLLPGRLDEALAAFERARQCKVQLPMSGVLLGKTLLFQGEFSRSQLTLGVVSLQSSDPVTKAALPELVNRCTALLALEPRKAEIQAGRLTAQVPPETLDFGLFCAFTQSPIPAAGYFQRAFTDQPALLEEPELPLIAARTALQAAGSAAGPEEAARLRQLALQWAEAALASCQKHQQLWANKFPLIGGMPNIWRHHLDFAGVNSPAARANLPPAERLAWERFWDEADTFRAVP